MEQTKQEIESIINEIQKSDFQYKLLIADLIEYKTKTAQDLQNIDNQIADLKEAQERILEETQSFYLLRDFLKRNSCTAKEYLERMKR